METASRSLPPLSLAELRSRHAAGETFDFLFFWGHKPQQKGTLDQACLSQWFPSPFALEGSGYPTSEHYMMAEKARLFGDAEALAKILAARTPGIAKLIGRDIRNFSEAAWQEKRFDIVVRGNIAKFSQNPDLLAYLRSTGDSVLVQASPDDAIWGIGLSEFEDAARDPEQWAGQNLLGFAIMAARARLFAAR